MSEIERKPAYLVLGASGGIGSAVCRRLVATGSDLHLAARGEERLGVLSEETGAGFSVVDARRPEEVQRVAEEATERFGRLDGIVNCVGSVLLKPAHLTSPDEWEECLAQNLTTAFSTVRAAGRTMRSGGGSVVLVSSAAARVGLQNHEAVAAAKAGVIGLARSAAASYASRGLRVNVVAPGLVRTPLTDRITRSEAGERASLSMHALGRLGEPDDVASMIAWLLDPENNWVTGQVFGVDGGLGTLHVPGR